MVTRLEKQTIQVLGIVLVIFGVFAFFFGWRRYLSYYPYREYAMPLIILGILVLVIGLAVPLDTTNFVKRKPVYLPSNFCPSCGKVIYKKDANFCRRCGYPIQKID